MSDLDRTTIDAIADLTQRGLPVSLQAFALDGHADPIQGRRYFLTYDGGKHADITDSLLKTLPNPQYREGNRQLTSLASFSAFVNRMKEGSSVLFADKDAHQLRCIFDYHEAVNVLNTPPATDGGDAPAPYWSRVDGALPRWSRSSASYAFPQSKSWKNWAGKNKQPMKQDALAEWVEDNIDDVLDTKDAASLGAAATMLVNQLGLKLADRGALIAAARGLSLKVTEKVASAVNTTTGEVMINYSQEHTNESPAQIQVPSAFALALPVFEGGEWFSLLTRLRYRRNEGALVWWFDIYKLEKAVENAFTSACDKVAQETGLPLFYAKLT